MNSASVQFSFSIVPFTSFALEEFLQNIKMPILMSYIPTSSKKNGYELFQFSLILLACHTRNSEGVWFADYRSCHQLLCILLFRSSSWDNVGIKSRDGCDWDVDWADVCCYIAVHHLHDHCPQNELEKASRKGYTLSTQ